MTTPAAKKVKLEHEGTPPSSTPTPAPAQPYSTSAAWSTGQIPIDPALTQQTPTTSSTSTAATAAPTQQQQLMYQHYQQHGQGAPHYSYNHYQQYQPPGQSSSAPTPAPPAQTAAAPTPAPASAPTPAPAPPAPTIPTMTVARQPTTAQQATTNADTNDIATLNDALGSAGVDLRAEEENLARSQDHHTTYRSYEDRSRRQPPIPNFDVRNLQSRMLGIGKQHKVVRIPEDAVQYLALALRTRLQTLVTGMAEAVNHRAEAQYSRTPSMYDDEQKTPMWNVVVRRDTKKILDILEKVDREEELKVRRERKQREEAAAAQAALIAVPTREEEGADSVFTTNDESSMMLSDPPAPSKKSKKKKDGPGVTARNLSEDVQKRLSNAVATQAAGIGKGKYAWMNAGTVTGPKAKASTPAPAAAGAVPNGTAVTDSPSTGGANPPSQANTAASQTQSAVTWPKPYAPSSLRTVSPAVASDDDKKSTITMRDAMFVIEREHGHGGGRGAARGWV